ncbi:JmjC domain-containing protein [Shewanella marisflavi]|uniref:JmjC domain-containing protein n=1 Tax=Shewanella marisflavi TaxID=260364 RepID=UPI003AAE0183
MTLDLLAPYTLDDFNKAHYETKWAWLNETISAAEAAEVFDFDELERYLFVARPWDSNRHEFRVAKFPDKSFEPRVKSVEDVIDLYSQGYTLILDGGHLRHAGIAKICSDLSKRFMCAVQANIYVTPAGGQGFDAHFDAHDVMVLQTVGAKKWHLKDMPLIMLGDKYYNEYEDIDAVEEASDDSCAEVVLSAGERLYIPRGTIHKAVGVSDHPSIHITFSFFPITWNKLLEAAIIDGAVKSTGIMQSVPREVLSNLDSPETKAMLQVKLNEALGAVDMSQLWRFIYDRGAVLEPGKGVQSVLQLDQMNEHTQIRLREGADPFISMHGERMWVSFTGRRLGAPLHSYEFFNHLIEHNQFAVGDLPGDQTVTESKLVFVKWLITHGIAYIVSDS